MDAEQLKYQDRISNEACQILTNHNLVYLAMEMRTGKTITAMMICKKLQYKRVLMVSKKKALSSLESDHKKVFKDDFQFKAINFEQIHNLEWNPDIIIVDEAHSLSQYPKPSERTKRLKEIATGLPIIYLSGTPTPEGYSQIYHQFWISSYSPFSEFKNFYRWCDVYVNVKPRYLGQVVVKDYSDAKESMIKEKINHLFITLTQEQAGFNQVVREVVKKIEMTPAVEKSIAILKKNRCLKTKSGHEIVAETEVKLMSKIHQISSGTVIANEENALVFDYTKAHYIRDNYKGKKIAIYYKFVAEQAAILSTFGFANLTDDPMEFEKPDCKKIFYSQIQSGREGVALSTADYIIMYNIDFAAVSYFQVKSRMQSKNRSVPAELHWLFSNTGMEEKIYKAVQQKKDYTLSYFKKDFLNN